MIGRILSKTWVNLLCMVAGAAVGVFFIRDVSRWSLDYTVSVPHVLNIATTLTVAFFVQHILKMQAEKDQGRRELLVAQLTVVRNALETTRPLHQKGKDGKPPVGAAKIVRAVNNSIATLEDCATALSFARILPRIKEIRLKCMEYRSVMTSTDVPFTALAADTAWDALQQEVLKCLAELYSA